MKQAFSDSIQDYLKHIFELTASGEIASTNALAERMAIKPASVTVMVQKLAAANPALVRYQKHQGVTLTEEGRRVALEVIRHHRLIETWLFQKLGYSWDEVHEEADRLEHVISEYFESRIAAEMGHPLRDPHGELIPSADLEMPRDESVPLFTLRPNQAAVLKSIRDADAGLLRHLEGLGLTPGVHIEIVAYSPFDHNLTVKVGQDMNVLGLGVTGKIFTESTESIHATEIA